MSDVFNATGSVFNGAIDADNAVLNFAGVEDAGFGSATSLVGGVGPICQSLNWAYSQALNVIFEVGTNFHYMVRGRARGQLSIGAVVGPRGLNRSFYQKYGDSCNAASNNANIDLGVGCGKAITDSQATLKLKTIVLTNVGGSVGAADMMINTQTSGMFMRLEM